MKNPAKVKQLKKLSTVRQGKGSGRGYRDDDAFDVARCSDGRFNTNQVRILRALRDAHADGLDMTRADLKRAVGNAHKKGYDVRWVAPLRALCPMYVTMYVHESLDGYPPRHVYHITNTGLAYLLAYEKLAEET